MRLKEVMAEAGTHAMRLAKRKTGVAARLGRHEVYQIGLATHSSRGEA
jgi:hypothetical protein